MPGWLACPPACLSANAPAWCPPPACSRCSSQARTTRPRTGKTPAPARLSCLPAQGPGPIPRRARAWRQTRAWC
eukprot:359931-Chlamydomonas_euryale.AAC.2